MAFSAIDFLIVIAYLVGITAFGAHFRKVQHSIKDYFLGGRTAPWWAIALSIVSAETSTLTIIGTPALAFASNLAFLQLVFGYLVARILLSLIFIPQYFSGEFYTAYQLIERRFSMGLKRLTAAVFLFTRALAEGVRVFAISIVVSVVLGTGEMTSVILITLLTLFYTFEGGMTAVIWTDVIQMFIYVGGTLAIFFLALERIPGGWAEVTTVAAAAGGKLAVLDFTLSLSKTYTFWAGVLGGTFLTMASHGTDQLMVQRLLAARNRRDSVVALLSSGVLILFQFTLFLLVGVILYVFYQKFPPAVRFSNLDRVFPTFVVNELPHGVKGLVIAAILAAAMSNLSAALNSLASSTVLDFYHALGRQPATAKSSLLAPRLATLAWGGVMIVLGIMARNWGPVLEAGLTIASFTYGGLLGIFLLGLLTERANARGAAVGLFIGLGTMLVIKFATSVAWTWYVLIGTAATFSAGYLTSRLLPAQAPRGQA